MKRLFTFCVCLFASVVFFACSASTEEISQVQPTVEVIITPTPDPTETFLEKLRQDLEKSSSQSLSYEILFSDNTVTLNCYGDSIESVFSATLADYLSNTEKWKTVKDTANSLCNALANDIQESNLNYDSVVSMVSTSDNSVIYLTSSNGEITFDAMDILPESKIVFHQASMYKVGADLDPGEYYVIPNNKEKGVYVCVTSDGNGDDILENSFQKGPHYITVAKGEYLEITNGRFALAEEFPSKLMEVINGDGMYLVGKDIAPGEYKLTITEEKHGYYCIYSETSSSRKIVNNSLFDNAAYVTVADGQYLLVTSCAGIKVS